MKYYLLLSIGLYFLYPIESTIGPGDRKSSSRTSEKVVPHPPPPPSSESSRSSGSIPQESLPPSEINVLQRNLLEENINAQKILENYRSYCSPCADIRQFIYPTLIYITPWNNRGYDFVKMFPHKFDYICPVWFTLKRLGFENYIIEGTHDIDSKWIETLKEKRSDIRIVPRVLFEKWSTDDIHALFQSENEKQKLSLTLKNFLIEYDQLFDGYVFELLAQFQGSSKTTVHHIISDIAEHIHEIDSNTTKKKEVFLAVPPLEEHFDKNDFEILSKHIDGFNIMTYDFPTKDPGPVAPIGNYSSFVFFFAGKSFLFFDRMDKRNYESISYF
jgi:chitinase domain-containing protein 1